MPPRKEDIVSKELFEVHLEYIREDLGFIKTEMGKLGEKLSTQEETLLRNTITVEEHQRRSTMLEENQASIVKTLQTIATSVNQVKSQADQIEKELGPIKEQNAQVNKLMRLLIVIDDNKALIGKIIVIATIVVVSIWVGTKEAPIFQSIVKAIFS